MTNTANRTRPLAGPDSSSLARSIGLILSGYLVGTTAAHVGPPMMEACALGAGMVGLLAWGVTASVARQRRRQDARRAQETAAVKLEQRVEQHVRRASARLLLRLHAARQRPHEQYVTVVQSPRPPR